MPQMTLLSNAVSFQLISIAAPNLFFAINNSTIIYIKEPFETLDVFPNLDVQMLWNAWKYFWLHIPVSI
jgi:hypothetical protein